MKKKIFSIGLIVMLLSSLLLTATPAAGADLAVSTQATPPGVPFYQLAAGTDVAFLKIAPNGDMFVVDTVGLRVYKSVNNGRTWSISAPIAGPVNIVDLEVSPSYEVDNTVFILANTAAGPITPQVMISSNGGTTFAVLGGALTAAETATSLAISPSYSGGTGEVMVGTVNGAAATFGDVYIWGRGGVLNWVAQGLAEDVTDVAFSPNYPIDATILAVGSTAANTFLHTRVSNLGWDATIGTGAVTLQEGTPAAVVEVGAAAGNVISNAVIAIPSDFNGSITLQRTLYVAISSSSAVDRISRAVAGNNLGTAQMTPSATFVPDAEMTSMAFAGAGATGTLYAGTTGVAASLTPQVYRCANPTATITTWFGAATAPTGTLAAPGLLTYVALANDYATSNRIYAGTIGTDSALSVSDDGGVTFYQSGMIDTAIATIQDFQAASATEFFMITEENTALGTDSIWKTTDGGASWYRILAIALTCQVGTTGSGAIRLSPDYATDSTLYLADLGGAAGGTNIRLSNNGGATWEGRSCPISPGDVAVKDMYTLYVGSAAAGQVQSTSNAGWVWQVAATAITGAGACSDIEIDLATGHILYGDVAGLVYYSANNINYVPTGLAAGAAGTTTVAFDADYANTGIFYAAETGTPTAGIFRYNTGATNLGWVLIDGGITVAPVDILVAPDGTLYASDITAAAAGAGGLTRTLGPTAPVVTFERLTIGVGAGNDSVTAGDLYGGLAMAEGSNILFITNNLPVVPAVSAPNIRTYTDTMTTATPAVTAPADGAQINPALINVILEAVPGARNYQVQWNTRPDYFGVGAVVNIAWPNLATGPIAAIPAGTTIYYRARVQTPVIGPWSETRTVETHLAAAASTAPAIAGVAGGEGSTAAGGWGVVLQPAFQWGAIAGATAYEFQLATDSAMSNVLVDASGADALGVVTSYRLPIELQYNTSYFWRVRAISATTATDWSPVTVFTTMMEPADAATQPPPTVTTTYVPPEVVVPEITVPTITVPPITVPPSEGAKIEQVGPGYIWAVIIIGAILVIALIVLIVRTRRTV